MIFYFFKQFVIGHKSAEGHNACGYSVETNFKIPLVDNCALQSQQDVNYKKESMRHANKVVGLCNFPDILKRHGNGKC